MAGLPGGAKDRGRDRKGGRKGSHDRGLQPCLSPSRAGTFSVTKDTSTHQSQRFTAGDMNVPLFDLPLPH
jgi:hypothetical protein